MIELQERVITVARRHAQGLLTSESPGDHLQQLHDGDQTFIAILVCDKVEAATLYDERKVMSTLMLSLDVKNFSSLGKRLALHSHYEIS